MRHALHERGSLDVRLPASQHDACAGPRSAPAALPPRAAGAADDSQLWVEKHKPQRSAELVGNPTLIFTLRQWLSEWCATATSHRGPALWVYD